MIFVPFIQVVGAEERGENHVRRPASSTEPMKNHLRLSDEQLEDISVRYHEWRNGYWHTSQRRMETFLLYLASGGYHRQVGYTQGIAKSTAILHNRQVADFLMDMSPRHINFPRLREFDNLASPLQDVNGAEQRVILYIDGVIVKIQRPDHAGDAYFCGRNGKSCDSINVQYVVDKFGRVRHIITGLPGATHDKTAAEWSAELMQFLDQLPENYVVLADPAYRNLHPRVLHTFIGRNQNADQLAFNDRCTRLRQIVERSIGATELKWRMNQLKENRYPAKYGPLFAAKCTVSTCVLHNMYTNFL